MQTVVMTVTMLVMDFVDADVWWGGCDEEIDDGPLVVDELDGPAVRDEEMLLELEGTVLEEMDPADDEALGLVVGEVVCGPLEELGGWLVGLEMGVLELDPVLELDAVPALDETLELDVVPEVDTVLEPEALLELDKVLLELDIVELEADVLVDEAVLVALLPPVVEITVELDDDDEAVDCAVVVSVEDDEIDDEEADDDEADDDETGVVVGTDVELADVLVTDVTVEVKLDVVELPSPVDVADVIVAEVEVSDVDVELEVDVAVEDIELEVVVPPPIGPL